MVEGERGQVAQRPPLGAGRVVAGLHDRSGDDGQVVGDRDVPAARVAVGPVERADLLQLAGGRVHAGFLGQLTGSGLAAGLTGVDVTAGQGPSTLVRVSAALDQQHVPVGGGDDDVGGEADGLERLGTHVSPLGHRSGSGPAPLGPARTAPRERSGRAGEATGRSASCGGWAPFLCLALSRAAHCGWHRGVLQGRRIVRTAPTRRTTADGSPGRHGSEDSHLASVHCSVLKERTLPSNPFHGVLRSFLQLKPRIATPEELA